MAFAERSMAMWKRSMTRVLIHGNPNTRKTTSLATFPRPCHVIVIPGEKGSASLPLEDGLKSYIWDEEDTAKLKAGTVIREVGQLTLDIIAGKRGECRTIAWDGIHHYHQWVLGEVTGGASLSGEEFDSKKAYPRANQLFRHTLNRIGLSSVPYAVFTCWSGREQDKEGLENMNGPSHVFPNLPGQLAKGVLGEFGLVMYAEVTPAVTPGGEAKATWQLKPEGPVWGCSVKAPLEIVKKLPSKVPQDWAKLEPLLTGEKEVTS